MKKLISLLLCALLCVSLASCAKEAKPEDPDVSPSFSSAASDPVSFAKTEWASYEGYGAAVEYPSTWTLYSYEDGDAYIGYDVLMVNESEDIFIRVIPAATTTTVSAVLSASENPEAEQFLTEVRARMSVGEQLEFPSALEDEALMEYIDAIEKLAENPENPLPLFTGVLPAASASSETVQLDDNGALAGAQDAQTQLWGFIDRTGAWVIEPKYTRVGSFSEGLAAVQQENEEYIYIDASGQPVITGDGDGSPFAAASAFRNGWARVSYFVDSTNSMVYIDKTGNAVMDAMFLPMPDGASYAHPELFHSSCDFNDAGYAVVRRNSSEPYYVVDRSGKIYGSTELGYLPGPNQINEDGTISAYKDNKDWDGSANSLTMFCAVFDLTGAYTLPYDDYSSISYGADGLYCFSRIATQGAKGYMGGHGNVIIEPIFEDAKDFSEGLAAVQTDGLWGFIDRTGSFVIEPQFEEVPILCKFVNGYCCVKKNGQFGMIDANGKAVIDFAYKYEIGSLCEGLCSYKDESTELMGYRAENGAVAIPAQFLQVNDFCQPDASNSY